LYSAHALEGSESAIAGFLHASVQAIYNGIQIFQARGLSRTVQGLIGNTIATVGVRDFWENGCIVCFRAPHQIAKSDADLDPVSCPIDRWDMKPDLDRELIRDGSRWVSMAKLATGDDPAIHIEESGRSKNAHRMLPRRP